MKMLASPIGTIAARIVGQIIEARAQVVEADARPDQDQSRTRETDGAEDVVEGDDHAARASDARRAAAVASSAKVATSAAATASQYGAGMLSSRFHAFVVLGSTPIFRPNEAGPPKSSMIWR